MRLTVIDINDPRRMVRLFKKRLAMLLLLSIVLSSPIAASAYEMDVHFYLTYVLCRLAGFTVQDAHLVARADQSVDDNHGTTAFDLPIPPADWVANSEKWHALGSSRKAVLANFRKLACAAGVSWIRDRDKGAKYPCPLPLLLVLDSHTLVRLGEFLHFYEDTYAHSQYGADDTGLWEPYGST